MVQGSNWCRAYVFLPSATKISAGGGRCGSATQDLRISLRLRYARLNAFDLCSTEASGSTLMFRTGNTLGPDGTLKVADGA